MNKIKISYNKLNPLISEFLKEKEVELLEERKLIHKMSFVKKKYADIYFHTGLVSKDDLQNIKNAKKVIVNSFMSKKEVLKEAKIKDDSLIEVIYPVVSYVQLKAKESKKAFCEEFEIKKDKKIILFTAKNLKYNGVLEFCNILNSLNYKNYQAVIAGDSKQIYSLKFAISKYNFEDKLLFIEDPKDLNLLFSAADIFILPTQVKPFASNIIKAMFYKTAVFVTYNNAAREITDVYATMNEGSDSTTPFKVDALLGRVNDLKLIKKQNKKLSREFSLSLQIKKLKQIAFNI